MQGVAREASPPIPALEGGIEGEPVDIRQRNNRDIGSLKAAVMRRLDIGFEGRGAMQDEGRAPPELSVSCRKPLCQWICESPTCEEVCEPRCEPPRCETRCSGPDVSGCTMDCEHPHCFVFCPSRLCPTLSVAADQIKGENAEEKKDCRFCHTECSEPTCKLRCPQAQQCHNVCEHPRCNWHCKAPQRCPKPVCHMKCEQPQNGCILGSSPEGMVTFHERLPSIRPGERAVASFAASVRRKATAESGIDVLSETAAHSVLRYND